MEINFKKITYFFLDCGVFIVRNWKLFGGLICLLFIAYFVQQCRSGRQEKKIDQLEGNISTANGAIEILTNQKTGQEGDVNKASGGVVNAETEANKVRRQDINKQDNRYDRARERFCAKFPEQCL